MGKVWRARHVSMKFEDSSNVTIDTSSNLWESFTDGTTVTTAKNVTVTEPEHSVDKIDMLGTDANNFQNQAKQKNPVAMATISGTLVLDSAEVLETIVDSEGTTVSGTTTATRYQVGQGDEVDATFVVKLESSDGSDSVQFGFDAATLQRIGDIRLDSADGHWEQDFEAVCLAKDFYIEYYD